MKVYDALASILRPGFTGKVELETEGALRHRNVTVEPYNDSSNMPKENLPCIDELTKIVEDIVFVKGYNNLVIEKEGTASNIELKFRYIGIEEIIFFCIISPRGGGTLRSMRGLSIKGILKSIGDSEPADVIVGKDEFFGAIFAKKSVEDMVKEPSSLVQQLVASKGNDGVDELLQVLERDLTRLKASAPNKLNSYCTKVVAELTFNLASSWEGISSDLATVANNSNEPVLKYLARPRPSTANPMVLHLASFEHVSNINNENPFVAFFYDVAETLRTGELPSRYTESDLIDSDLRDSNVADLIQMRRTQLLNLIQIFQGKVNDKVVSPEGKAAIQKLKQQHAIFSGETSLTDSGDSHALNMLRTQISIFKGMLSDIEASPDNIVDAVRSSEVALQKNDEAERMRQALKNQYLIFTGQSFANNADEQVDLIMAQSAAERPLYNKEEVELRRRQLQTLISIHVGSLPLDEAKKVEQDIVDTIATNAPVYTKQEVEAALKSLKTLSTLFSTTDSKLRDELVGTTSIFASAEPKADTSAKDRFFPSLDESVNTLANKHPHAWFIAQALTHNKAFSTGLSADLRGKVIVAKKDKYEIKDAYKYEHEDIHNMIAEESDLVSMVVPDLARTGEITITCPGTAPGYILRVDGKEVLSITYNNNTRVIVVGDKTLNPSTSNLDIVEEVIEQNPINKGAMTTKEKAIDLITKIITAGKSNPEVVPKLVSIIAREDDGEKKTLLARIADSVPKKLEDTFEVPEKMEKPDTLDAVQSIIFEVVSAAGKNAAANKDFKDLIINLASSPTVRKDLAVILSAVQAFSKNLKSK